MEYTVCFYVNGYFMAKVKGETDDERRDALDDKTSNASFGTLENIEWDIDDASCYEEEDDADKAGEGSYNLPITARYITKIKTIFQESVSFISEKATDKYEEADFGVADDCDCYILWIEDDKGNRIHENLD